MVRKDKPTDQTQMLIEIRAGPRQEGLGGGFWSEEMVSTDWPLRNRAGVYGFRQDFPLKGAHKSQ